MCIASFLQVTAGTPLPKEYIEEVRCFLLVCDLVDNAVWFEICSGHLDGYNDDLSS